MSEYKLIPHDPEGVDLFEGQTQEKTANLIKENLFKENFGIIGIEGVWGSGKSNLIKILQKKLPSNIKMFEYDVWGHQEDDHRMAFLIELTSFITEEDNKLVRNKDHWQKRLKDLFTSARQTKVWNTPKLSIGVFFYLFAFIYSPLVSAFKDDLKYLFGIESVFWKILLVCFPIALIAIIWIFNVSYHLVKSDKKKYWDRIKVGTGVTFQVYTNQQSELEKTEEFIDSTPSVRDFKNWMGELNADLEHNKLVIVFDNLDRVSAEKVKVFWSNIHVFFASEKFENINVIIPFDRKRIESAFSSDYEKPEEAKEFVGKTFSIVYRVPIPIVSNWKEYFRELWGIAFPNASIADRISVQEAFEVSVQSITPRRIKVFLNDVVVLKRLNQSTPLEYIGVFALFKDQMTDNPYEALRNLHYLGFLKSRYQQDDDFPKYMTGLIYQLDPETAIDLVYRRTLTEAVLQKNTEKIREIAKTKLFSPIVNSVFNDIDDHGLSVYALNCIDAEKDIEPQHLKKLREELSSKIKEVGIEDKKIANYHFILLNQLTEPWQRKYLTFLVENCYMLNLPGPNISYCENLDKIADFCKQNGISLDPWIHVRKVGVSFEECRAIALLKKEDFGRYKIYCDNSSLLDGLLKLRSSELGEAAFIQYLDQSYDLEPYALYLRRILKANYSEQSILINCINLLKYTGGRIGDIGLTAHEILTSMNRDANNLNLRAYFFCCFLSGPISDVLTNVSLVVRINSLASKELILKIVEEIVHFIDFGTLVSIAKRQTILFPIDVVKELITKNDPYIFSDDSLVLELEWICTNLEMDLSKMLELIEHSNLEFDTDKMKDVYTNDFMSKVLAELNK